MKFKPTQTVSISMQIGKAIALFMIGGVFIHTLTMFLDYYLVSESLHLNLRKNFVDSIFSKPMIPMMVVYGLLLLVINFLWDKKKKSSLLAHKREVQIEKTELVLKSMQRMTGMLAEHIASHNAEIMHWVESRKIRGQTVSQKVEKPAKMIAGALQSLSEIAFILPYTENRPNNVDDIEKVLQSKLDEMTGFQESKGEHAKQFQ